MRLTITFLCCLFVYFSTAQVTVSGRVTDNVTGKGLQGVSVYINNTSIGSISNAAGEFVIKDIGLQKFDIIASFVGYETFIQTVTNEKPQTLLNISLTAKAKELDAVVIQAYEKDGWTRWGRTFTESFIGMSANAADCSIKNTKALRFRLDKKDNTLYVTATEPLVIENRALGYHLIYDLQSFSYDFTNHMLFYAGYPFFTEMNGNEKKIRRWNKNRQVAFKGSMMHFMRSFYRNILPAEGFTMYSVKRVYNAERRRVQKKYSSLIKVLGNAQIDSSDYFLSVLRQPDHTDYLNKNPVIADSIAVIYDSTTAGMSFVNLLQVVCSSKPEPEEYAGQQGRHPAPNTASLITLLNHDAIAIYQNGMYYDSTDILTEGFWAWSEKIAEMLPFDYRYTPN